MIDKFGNVYASVNIQTHVSPMAVTATNDT